MIRKKLGAEGLSVSLGLGFGFEGLDFVSDALVGFATLPFGFGRHWLVDIWQAAARPQPTAASAESAASSRKRGSIDGSFNLASCFESAAARRASSTPLTRISLPHRLCSDCVTGVPLPKAHPAPPNQRRRHVAHGPRCPCLHASAVEGSGAKRPVAKSGPITPCEGRCRRCQQATRTRVAL